MRYYKILIRFSAKNRKEADLLMAELFKKQQPGLFISEDKSIYEHVENV